MSNDGALLGKHSFDGETVEGLGLSPDGRMLFVSLLSPPTGGGRGGVGRRRTALLDVAPIGDARVELVELRVIERPVKTIQFSTDSRTVDIDGQLFTIGRVIADEPLPVKNPKEVRFTGDSSRLEILSGEDRWSSFDTATGLEAEGGAPVVPAKSPPPEINAAKLGDAIEVSVEGGSAHHSRWSKRGRRTSHLDQRRWVRANRSVVGGRAWRRLASAALAVWASLAGMDDGFPDCDR